MNFKRISSFTFVLSALLLTDVNSMENKLNNTLYYVPNKNIDNISSGVFIKFKENGICSIEECIGDEMRKKSITINNLSKTFNNVLKYSCSVDSISLIGNYLFIKNLRLKKNIKHFAIGNFTSINPTIVISIAEYGNNNNCRIYFKNIHELVFDNNYVSFERINNLCNNNFNISYNKITIGENTYDYKEYGIITVYPGKNNFTTRQNPQQNNNEEYKSEEELGSTRDV